MFKQKGGKFKLLNGLLAFDVQPTEKGFFDRGLVGKVKANGKLLTVYWNSIGEYPHVIKYLPEHDTFEISLLSRLFEFTKGPNNFIPQQMTIFDVL